MLDDWHKLVATHGPDSVVMIARTRTQVAHLNAAARQRQVAAGHVSGPQLARLEGGIGFARGDRVVCLRNDRDLDVDNGTRAVVVAIHTHRREVVIRPDGRDDDVVVLPGDYIADGHLDHAYAITGHKAQGLTVDHALVVADATIDGDWGYVAMSRGRHTNRLYVADDTAPRTAHAPEPPSPPTGDLARRLQRTRADTPLTQRPAYDPVQTALDWQRLDAAWPAAHTAYIEHDRLREMLRATEAELEDIDTRTDDLTRRLDETSTGLTRVTLTGRRQRRQLQARLDETVTARTAAVRRAQAAHRQLHAFGPPPDVDTVEAQRDRLAAMLDAVAQQRARRHEHHPPTYITRTLGRMPDDPQARAIWRDAAVRIEGFRARWLVDDPEHALGHPDNDTDRQRSRRQSLTYDLHAAVSEIHALEARDRKRGSVRRRT